MLTRIARWLGTLALSTAILAVGAFGIAKLFSDAALFDDWLIHEDWGTTEFAEPECAFSVSGTITVEGEPAEKLLIGLSFTQRGASTHAKTITDESGRFTLVDPAPDGCFGNERYIAFHDGRFLLSGQAASPAAQNYGPVESGDEVAIALVTLHAN